MTPAALYTALHGETGCKLFTVTVIDRDAELARRVYTSHPETYPVSGTKPMGQGAWTNMVIERGETFVANTVAEFAIYFPDHEVIASLGCRSALNVPVGDPVAGTVNILDAEGQFTLERVAACEAAIGARRDALLKTFADARLAL